MPLLDDFIKDIEDEAHELEKIIEKVDDAGPNDAVRQRIGNGIDAIERLLKLYGRQRPGSGLDGGGATPIPGTHGGGPGGGPVGGPGGGPGGNGGDEPRTLTLGEYATSIKDLAAQARMTSDLPTKDARMISIRDLLPGFRAAAGIGVNAAAATGWPWGRR
ncbi:MAG: hypothetical protein KDA25_10265 [Phycisphaerales bacterium]|nr:hypothetical protein [Phycisphaerales bacterium]